MMNSSHTTHGMPTIDCEVLIERERERSLRIAYESITRDSAVLEALHSARREMTEWQEGSAGRIAEFAKSLDLRFNERLTTASPIEKGPVDCLLDRYRADLAILGHYSGINLGYFSTSLHDNWRRFNCVASLSTYSNQIRSFDPESVRRDAQNLELEDADLSRFESALSEASQIRAFLLPELDAYEERFESYVSAVGAIVPGILARKSYCCDFTGSYGKSELDYVITPGNQCVVERIGQYYDAVLLEQLYSQYGSSEDIVAYSHRKLGWTTFEMELDRESDLALVLKSNFGFGSSSYFMSLLRYKGINAINAPFLIFYSGVRKAEFAGNTYSYRINEESFVPCFENAVGLHDEYRQLGEGAFVDKYFKKALSDLSDLLAIVVQTETFLEITTLERFGDLTSGSCNELIPDEGFSQIAFELSERDNHEVDLIAESIWECRANIDRESPSIRMRVNRVADGAARYGRAARLQELVTSDLVRNRLIANLSHRSANPAEVKELVDAIAPAEHGIYTKTYEGYELIEMRIAKAEAVLSFIDRIREIAEVVRFDAVLSSMENSCRAISQQGMSYYSDVIDPELSIILPKREQTLAALKELDARIDKAQNSDSDISWLMEQRGSAQQTLNELNIAISRLTSQKNRIEGFEKALEALA